MINLSGRRSHAPRYAFCAAVSCTLDLGAGDALSATPPSSCADRLVASSDVITPAWQQAFHSLEQTLERLDESLCSDVRLYLHVDETNATVEAIASGGRHALRPVREPTMLVPIALGLLVKAPEEPEPEPAPA